MALAWLALVTARCFCAQIKKSKKNRFQLLKSDFNVID